MSVTIIVAKADNNAIGKDNDLLWHMPADMRFFVEQTTGHPVIMGRKNYDSIPDKYRPLKDRPNLIVTRDVHFTGEGTEVFNTVEQAIDRAKELDNEIYIIGGGQIYAYVLQHDLCDRLLVTEVHTTLEADVFFPEIEKTKWIEVSRTPHKADEKNPFDYTFVEYIRR